MSAYYVIFQFSHAYMRPFCSTKLQKITKHFQCGYKTETRLKHRTHYTIFQNRRICAGCQLYGLTHYADCAFCPIYMTCVLRLFAWLIRLFMRSWLVWALSAWERKRVWRFCVFVIVDVKYIIYYRCICKFICSL